MDLLREEQIRKDILDAAEPTIMNMSKRAGRLREELDRIKAMGFVAEARARVEAVAVRAVERLRHDLEP